jgi:sRNA-binding regulator protein Hfq
MPPKAARPVPPETTNAEAFYYAKQMAARTPMVVVLTDGEVLHGVIEWYDRDCIKVNRTDGPNLLVLKHVIKYMYKEDGGAGAPGTGPDETA